MNEPMSYEAFARELALHLDVPEIASKQALLIGDLGWDSLHLVQAVYYVEDLVRTAMPEQLVASVRNTADLYAAYVSYR